MPHGKRTREVNLTQVKKQTKDQKKDLVEQIKSIINDYSDIYVVYYNNESSKALQTLRETVQESKFSFASNNALQLALGKTAETSLAPRTHLLSKIIQRKCALMFTNLKAEDVKQQLEAATQTAYVQGGQIATQTIVIEQGHLNKDLYAGTLEPELRRLGMPTKLDNEVILVTENYTICEEGKQLNGAQASLLRHFGYQLAEFKIEPVCAWLKADQDILLLKDELAELLD
ncbi:Ribosomal_protein L10 [Hexamita inflata]|uniref:Ribosomal protein L10 n=1 Tax=Hexamita inflata TaxID=28002 RepID=A0AA86TV32_9EUKA|nr:Ribosomal protein L10 [Hexamita inflata]CAI9922708.1 Ribosomal protein L10 [Hexamita inflata]